MQMGSHECRNAIHIQLHACCDADARMPQIDAGSDVAAMAFDITQYALYHLTLVWQLQHIQS